ncbi:hypothetical protein GXW74_24810 [Roseomonas eburnea]|uniref:Universal stress protein n=1 Tax=Neoroseomonas eburnea TaxID=1346889 RepID=A0A9X9XJ36_9PROT|nr:hypothetical protein [Neoroseomonas eburnea]MBR0683722.1 hypothetical protein [Neoroseomonas eburnea]
MPPTPRRLLLDLGQAAAGHDGIEAAALIARMLELDLLGVFVEDEALLALAALPFARELRLPSHAWSTIEAPQVAAELGQTAARLRRLLEQHCARLGIPAGFEVVRGDPAACLAGLRGDADMLALVAPGTAAGRSFGAFPRAWDAALRSDAPVLLLPPGGGRTRGPVVSISEAAGMAPLDLALRLAAASGEDLLLLQPPGAGLSAEAAAERAHASGLGEVRVKARPLRALSAGAIAEGLGTARERLLVLAREVAAAFGGDGAPRLAAQRHAPVLVR